MTKHPGGRPTDYEPRFCKMVDEYIKSCTDKITNNSRIVNLPKREGFAKLLGFPRQTLDNWANEHKEFFDALARIDEEQKIKLLDQGLAGNYNPTIAKLVLSSNHGMKEKSESDITSAGERIQGVIVEFK